MSTTISGKLAISLLGLPYREYKGKKVPRNVGNYLPVDWV